MIKTLRITTLAVAAVCLVLIISVAAFGLRGDPKIEKMLAAPSVLEGLKEVLAKTPAAGDQVSPLVLQAKGFALRINPPPPPPPPLPPKQATTTTGVAAREPDRPSIPEIKVPVNPAGRFDVVATCRYDDDPGQSMALLNLPGKGLKWFRVGENVEHLVLTGVNDGSVVVSQAVGTESVIAMKQERSAIRDLLATGDQPPGTTLAPGEFWEQPVPPKKGSAYVPPKPETTRTYSPSTGRPIPSVSRTPGAYVPPTTSRTRTPPPEPTVAQRKAVLDDNITDIKKIMSAGSTEADPQAREDQEALMKLLQLLETERKAADSEAAPAKPDK